MLRVMNRSFIFSWLRWSVVAVLCSGLCISRPVLAAGLPITNGLALWLGADSGVSTNGVGKVTTWSDLSGAGHAATQASASAQPALVTGVLNGLPVVRFSGSQFMNLSGQVLTSQVFSIIVVTCDTSASTSYRELFSNWASAYGGTSIFIGTTSQSPVRARFTDDFGGASTGQTGVGTLTNPATHFIFSGISGSNHVSLYQNTGLLTNRPSALSSRTLTGSYVIGQQGSLNGEYWNGDIAELLVYNREVSAGELADIWQYLLSKYLPGNLPPSIQSIASGQNQAAITFSMARRTNYYVETISSLTATNWTTLTQFSNSISVSNVTVLDPLTNAQRYYRLRLGP